MDKAGRELRDRRRRLRRSGGVLVNGEYVKRDRGFESISLQRRAQCEPDFLDPSWRRRLKEGRANVL